MGWAARSKRRAEFNGPRCAHVATQIRDGVALLSVELRPFHSLERMVREAEWLASLGPDLFLAAQRLDDAGLERFVRAIIRMEQAERIGASLSMLPRIGGGRQMARWMTERVERFRIEDENVVPEKRQRLDREPALDALFELEVASRMARYKELVVSLEEPDILITLQTGHRLQIACKRPLRPSGVSSAIRDAASQIAARSDLGLVLIGMDAIFHRTDNPERPVRMAEVDRREAAQAQAERVLMEAATAGEEEIDRIYKKGARIPAVIFFGSFMYRLRNYGYSSYLVCKRVTNKGIPEADRLSVAFARRLVG